MFNDFSCQKKRKKKKEVRIKKKKERKSKFDFFLHVKFFFFGLWEKNMQPFLKAKWSILILFSSHLKIENSIGSSIL